MVGTAVVVSLTRGTDAAAGFIYLLRPRCHRKSFRTASRFPMPTTHEQADFAHAKSFVLCSFQPTKSACSASAEKCLSGVGQPLSSVSGRQRYNTLDFASKVVCHETAGFFGFFRPRKALPSFGFLPPRQRRRLWKPLPRVLCPLWIPQPTGRSPPLLETQRQRNCRPFGIPARFEMSTHKGKMVYGHSVQNANNPQSFIR